MLAAARGRRPAEAYGLKETHHLHVERGLVKPNKQVLLQIVADCGRTPEEAVYVGDSKMKDVVMAQEAGVLDVHAQYGEVQSHPGYDLLRAVSHWPDTAVNREKDLMTSDEVRPTFALPQQFCEILPLFDGA